MMCNDFEVLGKTVKDFEDRCRKSLEDQQNTSSDVEKYTVGLDFAKKEGKEVNPVKNIYIHDDDSNCAKSASDLVEDLVDFYSPAKMFEKVVMAYSTSEENLKDRKRKFNAICGKVHKEVVKKHKSRNCDFLEKQYNRLLILIGDFHKQF